MSASANKKQNTSVAFAIAFYMITSITMVIANKWVLNAVPDLPLVLLWFQIIIAVLLMVLFHASGSISFGDRDEATSGQVHEASIINRILVLVSTCFPRTNWKVAYRLRSLIFVNVVGLALNTLCLKFIDASLYQVARSLVLPFTVLLQYVFLKAPSSFAIMACCAVVCAGFFVGLFGDKSNETISNVSFLGVMFGLSSSVSTALHAIVIKSSMEVVKGNTLELAWYNNALSAFALIPLIIASGELQSLAEIARSDEFAGWNSFVFGTLVTGIFGFLINIAGFLQIKVTSPVTHMISSAVRGVLQTFLAVWLFSEILTASRTLGIALILIGSSGYTWIRSKESASKPTKEDVGSVAIQIDVIDEDVEKKSRTGQ